MTNTKRTYGAFGQPYYRILQYVNLYKNIKNQNPHYGMSDVSRNFYIASQSLDINLALQGMAIWTLIWLLGDEDG